MTIATSTQTHHHADPATHARQTALDRRHAAERVLELADHLTDPDRLLLEQVFRHGLSIAEVARLTGERPRTLQRRVRRLLQHINDPVFRFAVARFDILPREMHATVRRATFQRRSLRETARLTGLSLHRVRQHLSTLRTLARHS